MFGNDNSKTNGEYLFYIMIRPYINSIFDIGCRADSEFLDFEGDVHYFDPVNEFIVKLSNLPRKNKHAYFNSFGLGNESALIEYYPRYQSFFNRVSSCKISDIANKQLLTIKTAKEYIHEHNISSIDFVKIDTEGYELNVLKGFGESLKNVNIIQFEYGGTFLDNNTKLIDVINYLENLGFYKFAYLSPNGPVLITDFTDHYQYCNIVCINKRSPIIPY